MDEKKKYREIRIEPVLNGFIVHIGCKKAVFNDYREMVKELKGYYDDPQKVEDYYIVKSFALIGEAPVPETMQVDGSRAAREERPRGRTLGE